MKRRTTLFVALANLAIALVCSTGSAQSPPWGTLPDWRSNLNNNFTMSVALADLDQDGYLDLVAGSYRYPYTFEVQQAGQLQFGEIGDYLYGYHGMSQNQGALNDGPNPFTLIPRCIDCIAIADYDDDRDLDIAVGAVVGAGNDGGVWVFKNRLSEVGQNWYTLFSDDGLPDHVWHPTESYDAHCVRWVDYNLDGLLDLAVLEVGGMLHLYRNYGAQPNGPSWLQEDPNGPIDFSGLMFNNMSGTTDDEDELSRRPASIQLVNVGTTMEFGDLDDDGDPDMFINVGGMPDVFEHRYPEIQDPPFYDPNVYWKINEADWHQYRKKHESMACASFGFYDNGLGPKLSLAIGSMDFATTGDPQHFDAWRNDIYTYSTDGIPHLDHVWQSNEQMFIMPVAPQTQLVTDIQWARIQGEQDMDLVTASYPCSKKIGENSYDWDRGLEFFYQDPSTTNDTRSWQSAGADLSTSLALGDVGNEFDRDNPTSEKIILGITSSAIRALYYLEDMPVYEILDVFHRASGSVPWYELDRSLWCADMANGWVSIKKAWQESYPGAFDLRIRYWANPEFDLAVGNDGQNVVYFYQGTSTTTYTPEPFPALTDVNPEPPHQYDPADYGINPSATTVDLMAKDAVGAAFAEWTGPYGTNASAIGGFLGDHPKIKTALISTGWGLEILRGHYFWDRLDKNIDAVEGNGDVHLFTTGSPFWVLGNRQPPQQPLVDPQYDDLHARPSDERLQAMFVRNVVNRYRPHGYIGQVGIGYSWGDWGVKMFQFENEPPAPAEGYGAWGDYPDTGDDCIIDLADRIYRQYQMIKQVQATSGYSNILLSVVSPNWGQHDPNNFRMIDGPEGTPAYNNNGQLFAVSPIPYLNALNQVNLSFVPNPPGILIDGVLWRFTDYISQQMYNSYYADPFATGGEYQVGENSALKLGIEHNYWSYYTEGMADYVGAGQYAADWTPPMQLPDESFSEHPFVAIEWNYWWATTENYPADYYAAHLAELFSVDVFPDGPNEAKDHRLLTRDVSWRPDEEHYINGLMSIFETVSELLNDLNGDGKTFHSYTYENFPVQPSSLVKLVFMNRTGPPYNYLYFLRTLTAPKTSAYDLILATNLTQAGSRIPVYNLEGDYMDRQVLSPPMPWNYKYIEFAPNELNPDHILMVQESPLAGSGSNYNQAIQLERGWNLVSWYVEPYDPTPLTPSYMDDLFSYPSPPPGEEPWFQYDNYTNPTDKVGRYDRPPQGLMPEFYPQYGSGGGIGELWDWSLRQSYAIYMDSPAHFWEFTSQPLYVGSDPFDDFSPNDAWDDYTQVGIPNTPDRTCYWFFISYPQRMWLTLSESSTIDFLRNYAANQLQYIKDDNGQFYNVSDPTHSTLEYLQPGKGYFLGYRSNAQVVDCPWFFDEVGVPASHPPELDPNQNTTFSAPHYQFKSRTHWWYPIEIDTIAVEGLTPAEGDEIAVFCGDLCVGAMLFEGQYPLYLATWMDDMATPYSLDGYLVAQEMTFKWFDVSANQELSFVPPPEIQAMEADPYFPTHSGFGTGFAAKRSLVNGVQNVVQLPQEYRVGDCYPNPFNAETVIPLELPQRSDVKIELYDLRGCKLNTLYQGIQNAGVAKIRYRATGLSSGVYFYRVTAMGLERGGKFIDVGKMLVLK